MSGNKFLSGTNIILYIPGGDKIIANYLIEKILYTSIICKIKLLSFRSITLKQEREIIAANAVNTEIPLVNSDKDFKLINELQIDFYNN